MPALPSGWTPYAVTGDADGTVWTTLLKPAGLVRVAGDPELEPLDGRPMLLAADRNTLWYTRSDDRIGRRDPSGTHTTFATPAGSSPYGIAVAPDGTVWFTAAGSDRIGRLRGGTITMIDLPLSGARPAMITTDRGGTPWAALNGAEALAVVRPGDTVELVRLPEGSAPVGITAAPDGVWFADIARGLAGRVAPSGAIDEFRFPDPACRPHAIAPDPAGGCWVTLWGSTELARVTASGEITRHRLPGAEPHGLWVCSDQVWVAMESGALVPVSRDVSGANASATSVSSNAPAT
ncbi:hydrolase [Actinoplanes sp. SE50]|uniref:Vgb family protein n=1 Tax=unclassified Actinoplanes TaxID=2626549 RepID=UPI00023EC5D3|nr:MULTISPECIES: hydrolase [unclassified Actinoplanes]AEV83629.1 hydrolase [Actinoplanes sp. SE50/110]ATO82227.1 hydrolase [Actinoplanes sp. SE50]SLL99634.1 hydrolase [Actinoplanes sp. SE50/110]